MTTCETRNWHTQITEFTYRSRANIAHYGQRKSIQVSKSINVQNQKNVNEVKKQKKKKYKNLRTFGHIKISFSLSKKKPYPVHSYSVIVRTSHNTPYAGRTDGPQCWHLLGHVLCELRVVGGARFIVIFVLIAAQTPYGMDILRKSPNSHFACVNR